MLFSRKKVNVERKTSTPLPASPSLELDNVTVSVEDSTGEVRTIINRISISFTAPRTAILGLNGTGKSTLLGLLNGIVQPSHGTVKLGSLDVSQDPQAARKAVGMLFANPDSQLIMPTVLEDLDLSLRRNRSLSRSQRQDQARKLLAAQGLSDKIHQSIFSLSGGEKQLVALTGLLAVEPQVLLLDEPTTLLDLRNRARFIRLLSELEQMLVISTHDLDLARTCHEAVIIHDGQLVYHGDAQDTVEHYRSYCEHGFPQEEF